MSLSLLLSTFLIFCARVTDVSLGTFRILLLVRGHKGYAALIGFFEIMIYMTVLSHILGGGRSLNFIQLIGYCGGYATGNFVGSLLEGKFLPGSVMGEAIAPDDEPTAAMVGRLRESGFGVTVIDAEGRDAARRIIQILCKRSEVPAIKKMLIGREFLMISSISSLTGGYFHRKAK